MAKKTHFRYAVVEDVNHQRNAPVSGYRPCTTIETIDHVVRAESLVLVLIQLLRMPLRVVPIPRSPAPRVKVP